MTLQTVSQAFRTISDPTSPRPGQDGAENAFDAAIINGATYSTGSTILDESLLGGPTGSQNWTIISIAIQACLCRCIFNSATDSTPVAANGRLGKIVAGTVLDGTMRPSSGSFSYNPSSAGILQLPPDVTLMSDLWDPDNDPLPPQLPIEGTVLSTPPPYSEFLPVACSIIPQTPIKIPPGVSPLVGMWMYPSVYSANPVPDGGYAEAALALYYGRFTINYDDGQ